MNMKAWLLGGLLIGQISGAMAGAPDAWKELTFSYQEDAGSVSKVLKVFSQAMGVKTQINFPGLLEKSATNSQSILGTPIQVLDRLASTYQFQWYVYRNVLYISDYSTEGVEHIHLKSVTPAQAKQLLTGMGLFEPKFGWSELERGKRSTVVVSGPQSYLQSVKAVLARISVEDPVDEERQIMVFPLKYASAVDVTMPSREGIAVRPGVTTILKNLLAADRSFEGGGVGEGIHGAAGLKISRNLMKSESMPSDAPVQSILNPLAGKYSINSDYQDERREDPPAIEAYPALNAVVIKDKPSRRPIYEALFRSLDVEARRIELIVTIVDVDIGKLDEWIPQISIGGSKNNIRIQPQGGTDVSAAANIVLVSTNNFAIALKNSESSGHARIQSRPSIMTLDNLSAILDLSQTAYFKLVGERAVDLKSVTVGTRLKVTPRVLRESAGMHVQIELEDGTLQEINREGELTQSRSSFIGTQAVIEPGQSLLIGGYRRDANEETRSHVPFFSKLPAVGEFFKSETTRNHRVERLFVLSARVVDGEISSVKEQARNLQQDVILE